MTHAHDMDVHLNGTRCSHAAQVYTRPGDLVASLERFVVEAIESGEGCVLVATRGHWRALTRRLARAGRDGEALRRSGRLLWFDARESLARVMDDREPNRDAFHDLVCPVIEGAKSRFAGLRVFGEMVNLLWRQENQRAADLVERWWNDLIEVHGFSLLCGYRANVFEERAQPGLHRICCEHTQFLPLVDGARFEESLDAALQELIPEGDVQAMRQSLIPQCPYTAAMPEGMAMLFALREILPPLANDLRIRARRHYLRMQ